MQIFSIEMNKQKENGLFVKRKSYISLLETLIAVSLLSILLTIVFGIFHELSGMSLHMENQQKESFQLRYLESRLTFIFERIVNDKDENKRPFYFYLSPPQNEISSFSSLIFTFNNEVHLDPLFSSDVLGRLYVDHAHRLCLAVWPLHVDDPLQSLRQEILFENVAHIDYEFYTPPEQIESEKDIKNSPIDPKQPPKDTWIKEWPDKYKQMPGIIKIKLFIAKDPKELERFTLGTKIETTELLFSFVLPSSINFIYYPPQS